VYVYQQPNYFSKKLSDTVGLLENMHVYKKKEGTLTAPSDWSIFLIYNFGDANFDGGSLKIKTWAESWE